MTRKILTTTAIILSTLTLLTGCDPESKSYKVTVYDNGKPVQTFRATQLDYPPYGYFCKRADTDKWVVVSGTVVIEPEGTGKEPR